MAGCWLERRGHETAAAAISVSKHVGSKDVVGGLRLLDRGAPAYARSGACWSGDVRNPDPSRAEFGFSEQVSEVGTLRSKWSTCLGASSPQRGRANRLAGLALLWQPRRERGARAQTGLHEPPGHGGCDCLNRWPLG